MKDRSELSVTIGTAKNLVSYFGATIIGSTLLELSGILDFALVNDVDVAVNQNNFWNIRNYLIDNGFKETTNSYKQEGYADTIGSLIFKKDRHLPIHILIKDKDFKLKSISEIVQIKFERYSDSDRNQLKHIISNNINNEKWKDKIKK